MPDTTPRNGASRQQTVEEKEISQEALARTVQVEPTGQSPFYRNTEATYFWIAQQADDIEPWGRQIKLRDQQLRDFIPVESNFGSALGIICTRNAAFSWKLEGPPRLTSSAQDILGMAHFGAGWSSFVSRLSIDLYTQDSGAFIEVIRQSDSESAPLVGISNLDAARCYPTGIPEEPVVYLDRRGTYHRLKWYQVIQLLEMPAAFEGIPGVQYCALTRMFRAVGVMRDISLYLGEKVGGRNARSITAIKGVTAQQVADAYSDANTVNDAAGLMRFMKPILISGIDPTADIGFSTLDLASIPDGFDLETMNKWYMNSIAMAFFEDYQTFAPLPGARLGSGAQSEVLLEKSKGKGPALFQKVLKEALNWNALPKSVEFKWDEQDSVSEKISADTALVRAQERAARIQSGEVTAEVARDLALEHGDLSEEQIQAMQPQAAPGQESTLDEGATPEAQDNPIPVTQAPSPPPGEQQQQQPSQSGATLQEQLGIRETTHADRRAGGPQVSQARLDTEDEIDKQIEAAFERAKKLILSRVS